MKYLLLLILPLLTNAVISGSPPKPGNTKGKDFYAVRPGMANKGIIKENGTHRSHEACLREVFSDAFIVSAKDSFPIQVGAFRKRSNAEKIFHYLKNQPDIKVRIFTVDGLFKVRITGFPVTGKQVEDSEGIPVHHLPSEPSQIRLSYKTQEPSYAGYFHYALYTSPSPGSSKEKSAFGWKPLPVPDVILTAGQATDSAKLSGMGGQARPDSETSEIIDDSTAGRSRSSLPGESPWLKRIKYFGESFALVNALIVTILFFIGTMITLLIIILLNRRRMEKEQRLHQYLMEKYQSLIVDYLYGSATSDEFRSIASDNYSRQVLIDQMIDVSVNLKGEESKKLISLYKHLGLDRDSMARAHDYRWHKKIKGFRELAFMNIKDANDAIYKALNSSNEILRMEAQIALVSLS